MEVFTLGTFISGLIATILPSVIAAVVAFKINKKSDIRYEETKRLREEREAKDQEVRAEQIQAELVSMEMQAATASLSYACAMALKRGQANGEVEIAVSDYKKAKSRYTTFINGAYAEHKVDQQNGGTEE